MNSVQWAVARTAFDPTTVAMQVYRTGGNTNAVHLYTANVSYMAPLGSGLTITAGIMPTLIGYEVENQNGNFFITRSMLWNNFSR